VHPLLLPALMRAVRQAGLLLAAAALSQMVLAGCSGSGQPRVSFQIVGYRFHDGFVEVDSQRPSDPGCFVQPELSVTTEADGLHLRVTYLKTDQKFCILPCPVPLTQRQRVPPGATGLPVVLDGPAHGACVPVTGGPATVP